MNSKDLNAFNGIPDRVRELLIPILESELEVRRWPVVTVGAELVVDQDEELIVIGLTQLLAALGAEGYEWEQRPDDHLRR